MSEIHKNLAELRVELGLSQQDAAVLIGVSRITYIKWEQNPDTMPIGKYEQLLAEFKRLSELKD